MKRVMGEKGKGLFSTYTYGGEGSKRAYSLGAAKMFCKLTVV
jgi:hypothetical protein